MRPQSGLMWPSRYDNRRRCSFVFYANLKVTTCWDQPPRPNSQTFHRVRYGKGVAPLTWNERICDPQFLPSIQMKEFVTPNFFRPSKWKNLRPQFFPSIQMKEICDPTHPSKLQKKTQNNKTNNPLTSFP